MSPTAGSYNQVSGFRPRIQTAPETRYVIPAVMLTINEIFYSVQGESSYAGQPCVFVRLTACDLRCSWCDTPYAFDEGRKMSIDEVVASVEQHGCPLVEITGGEPLLQEDVYALMSKLGAAGKTVMLETGGH